MKYAELFRFLGTICFIALIGVLAGVSFQNDYIKLNVERDSGVFTLGTLDDQPLVDGYPSDFSHNNFKILYDGYDILTNELGHPETAPLVDTSMMVEDGIITTEWAYDDLIIWQKLRFLEEDSLRGFLNVEVFIYNEGTDSHTIGMQYFLDMNVDGNDNPVMAVPWEFVTHERIYDDEIPGYWLAYSDLEDFDSTTLFSMGIPYGRDAIMPDEILLSNSEILREISMDHAIRGDPLDDASVLLHWDDMMVHPTDILIIEFNYGLPYPNFDDIEDNSFEILPNDLNLMAYPNPFNNRLKIQTNGFDDASFAEISIYNSIGHRVQKLFAGNLNTKTEYDFKPNDMPSGSYFIILKTEHEAVKKKIQYIK